MITLLGVGRDPMSNIAARGIRHGKAENAVLPNARRDGVMIEFVLADSASRFVDKGVQTGHASPHFELEGIHFGLRLKADSCFAQGHINRHARLYPGGI